MAGLVVTGSWPPLSLPPLPPRTPARRADRVIRYYYGGGLPPRQQILPRGRRKNSRSRQANVRCASCGREFAAFRRATRRAGRRFSCALRRGHSIPAPERIVCKRVPRAGRIYNKAGGICRSLSSRSHVPAESCRALRIPLPARSPSSPTSPFDRARQAEHFPDRPWGRSRRRLAAPPIRRAAAWRAFFFFGPPPWLSCWQSRSPRRGSPRHTSAYCRSRRPAPPWRTPLCMPGVRGCARRGAAPLTVASL